MERVKKQKTGRAKKRMQHKRRFQLLENNKGGKKQGPNAGSGVKDKDKARV
jgi:hypothetical protein